MRLHQKYTLSLALFMALLLFLLSCAPAPKQEVSPAPALSEAPGGDKPALEEEAQTLAQGVLARMLIGDYAGILEQAAPELKSQITAEQIRNGFEGICAMLGAYTSTLESETELKQSFVSVQMTLQHEKGSSLLICTYNDAYQLAGLFIQIQSTSASEAVSLELASGAQEIPVLLFPGTDMELKGMIVLPENANEKTPAAVFAHGSGTSDMDERIGANKPFRDIAYGLAKQGVASIRYDKLYFAHPELAQAADITVDDEYIPALQEAIRVLKTHIDTKRITLIGHSQGGMLTPYLMHECPALSSGVVLAGSPRKLYEILIDQNMAAIGMLPEDEREGALDVIDEEFEKIMALPDMSDEERMRTPVFGISGHYMHHFNEIDAILFARQNARPMLFLQGEADFQISLEHDFSVWQGGLSGVPHMQFKSYSGLNHIFMSDQGGSILNPLSAYSAPDTVDSEVVNDIAAFILAQK